jgi:hypothetical protein
LPQAYTLGRLGVFGLYVTSAAASLMPLDAKTRRDPGMLGIREPQAPAVARVKLLIEAGFLVNRGVQGYGREDEKDSVARAGWTFDDTKDGAARRAACADAFWPALHSDLRMVDTSDFVVAHCPTNVYSVGTPHEIILARQQRKPVLFVTPPFEFPALAELRRHLDLAGDRVAADLLEELVKQAPIKDNATGAPSQWYMPLVGGEHFFDGFGFYLYQQKFSWTDSPLDRAERQRPPKKPLLPFLAKLNDALPPKWDRHGGDYGSNDDWILWDIQKLENGGAAIREVRRPADGST